jgi:hypothetical protein
MNGEAGRFRQALGAQARPRTVRSVALLGPPIEHRDSLEAMCAGRVERCVVLPDSASFFRERGLTAPSRLRRFALGVRRTQAPEYMASLLDATDTLAVEVVIGYWGTLPLFDLMALKKARPSLKIVLILLCYPLALDELGLRRQWLSLRMASGSLDGILCPTRGMVEYLQGRVLGRDGPALGVLSPCWPAAFQAQVRPDANPKHPNLVFIGRTDLSGLNVHAADDVRSLMRALLEAGIELHHARSAETEDGHPLRKPFAPLPIRQLIATMPRYDASLIAYNLAACRRTERFDLTVPDRLLSSVAGGVPIAVPRRGYRACKAYLERYGAMFEFEDVSDLARQLADHDAVEEMRQRAWRNRSLYTAEAQGPSLLSFVESVARS